MAGYGRHNKNKANKKHLYMVAALCLIVFAAVAAVLFSRSGSDKSDEVTDDQTMYGDESLGIDAAVDEQLRDYHIIGLLGIDSGGRSDIIMAISINKKTDEARIVTIHRDTYMQISADPDDPFVIDGVEREFYKCNRAYKKGGKYMAMAELNRHMDLNMREIICIDWDGTAALVDRLGGVEVDLDYELWEAMNGELSSEDQIAHAGTVTLNGVQAVEYFRARKYPGGSAPVREARAQEFVKWLFEKAKGMKLSELTDIYNDIAPGLDTNMSRTTIAELLLKLSKMELIETDEWPYEYTEMWQNDDSYYYFVADTLETNAIELHEVLFDQKDYKPSETLVKLNSRIEDLRQTSLY